MHVAAALFVAMIVVLLLAAVGGVTVFIAIPVALIVFAAPIVAIGVLLPWLRDARRGQTAPPAHPSDGGHVPTSGEASYDPVVRPEERAT
jgi:hypothetical protein